MDWSIIGYFGYAIGLFFGLLAFKYRNVVSLIGNHWINASKGAKLAIILRHKDKFLDFKVWVPGENSKVREKDSTGATKSITISPESVYTTSLLGGQVVIYLAGDDKTLDIASKADKVENEEALTDALARAEREGASSVKDRYELILYAAVAAAVLAAAAAFLAFSNADTLNIIVTALGTAKSSISPIVTEVVAENMSASGM